MQDNTQQLLKISILTLMMFVTQLSGYGQSIELSGIVLDAETKEGLPFATIGYRDYNIGTVSDQNGKYILRISEKLAGKEVVISFIGYEDFIFTPVAGKEERILLKPSIFQFEEVVINSLSPEEYLKKVIARISENYLDIPFETLSYYRERFDENKQPIHFVEAAFVSYQHPYELDSANQHQLVLYNKLADEELQFLSAKREKREKKAKAKAKKNGEEYNKDENKIVDFGFSGPENALKEDPVRALSTFLDSTLFRKFKYEFLNPTIYNGRQVEVVQFEARGKIDHQRPKGTIYIDKESLAIIKIEEKSKFVIPLAIKPLLYAFGFSLSDGKTARSFKYKSFNGKWFPENIHISGGFNITKHKMFSKNEHGLFEIEQVFSTKNIATESAEPIVKDHLFDKSKEMKDQVVSQPDVDWSHVK